MPKKTFTAPLELKADGQPGEFKAVFSTLNVIDLDKDVTVPGAFPEDGFSGYQGFARTPRTARWGDYTAAVADAAGDIWFGVEYIPNLPRTVNANWGTFIAKVTP